MVKSIVFWGAPHLVPGIRRFLADEDPAATSCTVDIAWSAPGHRLDFDVEKHRIQRMERPGFLGIGTLWLCQT